MNGEIPPFSVKLLRFQSGERYASVVDGSGFLATQPNIYGLLSLRERAQSVATNEKRLRAVCLALNWAAEIEIDLHARAGTLELLTSFEMASLRDALRRSQRVLGGKRTGGTVTTAHFVDRCHAVRDYIAWHAANALQRIRLGDSRLAEGRHAIDRFLSMMDADLPSAPAGEREGVAEDHLQTLLAAVEPGSVDNPFQKEHQHRNFALLLLYHETGLRRAEALKLKGEDLVLHGNEPYITVVRRPDDPEDPRACEPRVKTHGRPVPISDRLASALRTWIFEHRSDPARYPGAKRTPYVFVARTGRPLGLRTVNDMYDLLRNRLGGLPADLTGHGKRHAASVRFVETSEELGWSDAETALAMNHHFGWSKNSKQSAVYIKRHTRKKTRQIVDAIQKKSVKKVRS